MVSIEQIKAGRALINWAQQDLADQTGLSKTAIANVESGKHRPTEKNMQNILDAFDRNGVEFIDGGVRQKKDLIKVLEGDKGTYRFFEDVMKTAITSGGEFYVYGVDEEKFTEYAKKAGIYDKYLKTMSKVEGIHFNVLIKESDNNDYAATHVSYKKLPDDMIFTNAPFYLYGNKLALIIWRKKPKFIIISDQDLIEAYKKQFNALWKNARDA